MSQLITVILVSKIETRYYVAHVLGKNYEWSFWSKHTAIDFQTCVADLIRNGYEIINLAEVSRIEWMDSDFKII